MIRNPEVVTGSPVTMIDSRAPERSEERVVGILPATADEPVQVQSDGFVGKDPPLDDRTGIGDVRAVGGIRLPVPAPTNEQLPAEHVSAVRADQMRRTMVDFRDAI